MQIVDTPDKRLRVGVSLFIRDDRQQLWENGIFQNCFFLIMLLQHSPFVERCFVVNGGAPSSPDSAFAAASPAPIIDMATAMHELDVMVELSAQLSPEWAVEFRSRGGRIVGMRVANDYVIDAERMIYGLPHGLLMSGVPYDVTWTLPAFAETCAGYYKAGFRAPVKIMRHLWSPHFIENAFKSTGQEGDFCYTPGRKRWRLAIMEPNICSVKTCHLPLLLCDLAHRMNPKFTEVVRVFNALELKEHTAFVAYAKSTDLVQQGLATFEARFPTFNVLPALAEAVVSHHWLNGQNYLYYEALYGAFPLIHNSAYLEGCGYRYRDFDCEDGAAALLQAFYAHDLVLDQYKRQARTFLKLLDPTHEENVVAYSEALLSLFDDSRIDGARSRSA
jgi:hypothetical protein